MAGDDSIFTKDLISYDPLSETTRKERTSLLGLSMLGVALVKVPLVPERFSALGIDFSKVNQTTFVRLYALVIGYYIIAFALYALTDYIAWRRQRIIVHHEYERRRKERESGPKPNFDEEFLRKPSRSLRVPIEVIEEDLTYKGFASYWTAYRAARGRAVLEFLLPLAFSFYTLWVLLSYTPTT